MVIGNMKITHTRHGTFMTMLDDKEFKGENHMKIKRKVSQKNRVQIPMQLMDELKIQEGDIVLFDIEKNKITIEKEDQQNETKKVQKTL